MDVLDMTEEELEAELLRQLEDMPDVVEKAGVSEEDVARPLEKETVEDDHQVDQLAPATTTSSWNLLMSSVDQSSSMLKSYEKSIGEALELKVPPDKRIYDTNDENSNCNNGTSAAPQPKKSTTFLTDSIGDAAEHPTEAVETQDHQQQDGHGVQDKPETPRIFSMSSTEIKKHAIEIVQGATESGNIRAIEELAKEAIDDLSDVDRKWLQDQRENDRNTIEIIKARDDARSLLEEEQRLEREKIEREKRKREVEIEKEERLVIQRLKEEERIKEELRQKREEERKQQLANEEEEMAKLKEQLEEEARRHEALLMEESRQEMLLREERMRQLKARWDLEEKSAVLLQAHARKINAKKYVQARKNRLRCAIFMQKHMRSFIARRRYQRKLAAQRKKRFAAIVLAQSVARMHIYRRKYTKRLQLYKENKASTVIQKHVRGMHARHIFETRREKYLAKRAQASTKIQSIARMYISILRYGPKQRKKMVKSVVKIQSFNRMVRCRHIYASRVKIEREKRKAEERCIASVKIQCYVRRHLAKKKFQEHLRKEKALQQKEIEQDLATVLNADRAIGTLTEGAVASYARTALVKEPAYLAMLSTTAGEHVPVPQEDGIMDDRSEGNIKDRAAKDVAVFGFISSIAGRPMEGKVDVERMKNRMAELFISRPDAQMQAGSNGETGDPDTALLSGMREEGERMRVRILKTATALRKSKDILKESDKTTDADMWQRRRDNMVGLVRELKGMKNAYEDTLEAIEEKKAEMQIKHGRVEYCADLDLCQDTTLDALVRDICQYPNLICLNLSNLHLSNLSAMKQLNCALRSVQKIDMSSNMLTSNELRHLRKHLLANANVEHIDLESNEIESLRPMLCDASGAPCDRLSRLRHLNVKNNCILSMDSLGEVDMPCLEELFLYRNSITSIPSAPNNSCFFERWQFLQHIDLGRNNIDILPEGTFRDNKLLVSIILYENKLKDVPSGLHHVLLRELWLNGNCISTVDFHGPDQGAATSPSRSSYTPLLETLHLHDNAIKVFRSMPHAPFLKHIDLSFNNIDSFEDSGLYQHVLKKYKNSLEHLRLNDNPVCDLPDYREYIVHCLPALIELDGIPVTKEERMRISKTYGAGKHWSDGRTAATWNRLDAAHDGIEPYRLGKSKVTDWVDVMAAQWEQKDTSFRTKVSQTRKLWMFQRFENMCMRQRGERNSLLRRNKTEVSSLGATTADGSVHFVERKHCNDMLQLYMQHLSEHERFVENFDVISYRTNFVKGQNSSQPDPALETVAEANVAAASQRSNSIPSRIDGLSGTERALRPGQHNPNRPQTASSIAAIKFQALYRGYAVRCAMREKDVVNGEATGIALETQWTTKVAEENEDEFKEIDVDEFLSLDFDKDVDVDEFEFMENKMGHNGNAWGNYDYKKEKKSSVRASGFSDAEDDRVGDAGARQQLGSYSNSYSFVGEYNVQDGAQELSLPLQLHPPHTATSSMRGSPHPTQSSFRDLHSASETNSLHDEQLAPQDEQRRYLDSPGSCRSVQSQPISSTGPVSARDEFIRKEVEKVADEWGFTDHQVAQAMLNRRSKFNRAKSKRLKKKKLEDPDYKYRLLMKRVKANRRAVGSAGGMNESRSVSGGSDRKPRRSKSGGNGMGKPVQSQVGKDRLNMRRRNRRRMPAWRPTFEDENTHKPNSRDGHAGKPKGHAPPSTHMRLNNWTNNTEDDAKGESIFPPLK